jgi:hypothetical protein
MQKPFTLSLEQVMKNTDVYRFALTISLLLARLITRAIQTLLTMRARVIFPLPWRQTGQHYSTLITSARSMNVIVCPHCASSFDHTLDLSYATLIQQREAL